MDELSRGEFMRTLALCIVAGIALAELEFPEGVAVTMIVRGRDLIAPKGDTTLQPGDHVYVVAAEKDQAFLQLMFGNPESV